MTYVASDAMSLRTRLEFRRDAAIEDLKRSRQAVKTATRHLISRQIPSATTAPAPRKDRRGRRIA